MIIKIILIIHDRRTVTKHMLTYKAAQGIIVKEHFINFWKIL